MKPSQYNERYGMFASFTDDVPKDAKFVFSAKDCILAKGFEARGGSETLRGYPAPVDSPVVAALKKDGGFLVGKTVMDEFGSGSFCATSECAPPKNPYDLTRSCGGSSGGAACAAAVISGHLALASSTGAGITLPSAYCGVYGLTPTWGRITRNGQIDYAGSCDKIGMISADTSSFRKYLPKISFKDPADPTTSAQPALDLSSGKPKSLAIPKGWEKGLSKGVASVFSEAIVSLKSDSIDITEVETDSFRYAQAAYRVIAAAEGSSTVARFCGLRQGRQDGDLTMGFDDYFTAFRTEHLGISAKFMSVMGTYVKMSDTRERYYLKALSARGAVIKEFKKIFSEYDALLVPSAPTVAPKLDEVQGLALKVSLEADALSVPQNLAGMPHVSVPCGYSDGMPVGMQFVSDHWKEGTVIAAAEAWSKSFAAKKPEAIP